MRHLALFVPDVIQAKKFYTQVLKMQVEWEPDADNVYLTSDGGLDNLAVHKSPHELGTKGALDHFGFFVPTLEDVDAWYAHVKSHDITIAQEIKTHRDGARSFYFYDPFKNVIQILYHPPVAQRAARPI